MSVVCVIDDHRLLVDMLCVELRRSGLTPAPVPVTEDDLLAAVRAAQPAVVLLDLDLGGGRDGVSLVAPLSADGIPVLLVTGSDDPLRIAAGLEAGAVGYQLKSGGVTALVARTRQAIGEHGPLDPHTRTRLLTSLYAARQRRADADAPLRSLTERERAALEALTRGVPVPQISVTWHVSEATVRTHVRGVLIKLGVRSQLEAVALANRRQWFTRSRSR